MGEELTNEESLLIEILSNRYVGRANAVTARELELHGWASRQLRRTVHSLRVKGYPICSGQEGYYYAGDSSEILGSMSFIGSYLKHMQEAQDGLRSAYHAMKQQEGND